MYLIQDLQLVLNAMRKKQIFDRGMWKFFT